MIKKINFFILILISFIFCILLNNFMSNIAYSLGNQCFIKKDYECAKKYFKFAHTRKPINTKFQDSYIKALVNIPLNYQNQKELYDISKTDNSSATVIDAYKRLEKFQDTILSHFKNNYIGACVDEQKLIRWDEQQFPLTVYIKNNKNLTSSDIFLVQQAFKDWDKELNNFFDFKFIDNKDTANIILDFDFSLTKDVSDNNFYVTAQTYPEFTNKSYLKRMIISVNLFDLYGNKISNESFYATVLHEIGHALGIMGHSSNKDDLMYIRSSGTFTERDINTIKLLYLIIPDISNNSISKLNKKSRIYAPIITQINNFTDEEQYNKALTYIKESPNIAAGWIELASYYYQIKDYPMAIKSYLKAKTLTQSNMETDYINAQLGVIYLELKDYNKAILYLKNAQINQSNIQLKSLEAFAKIGAGNKAQGIAELKSLFISAPDNLDVGFLLADVYFSEFRIIETIKVLKMMKRANKNFNNESRKSKYKFINMIL